MVPGGQYNWAREVRLSEHRLSARLVNESMELPKITIENGIVRPRVNEAIVANVK